MANPEGPPTLFKLSCDALVAGCKLGSYVPTMDPQKVPPAVGKSVLNEISLMDIIIIASNENLYGWIASILPDNFVSIGVWVMSGPRPVSIYIEHEDKPKLFWDFVKQDLNDSMDQSQCFMLKFGNQIFPTEDYQNHSFDSYVSNFETAKPEIIEWICRLFRRELNEFQLYYGAAEYSNSPAILNARTFVMTDSCTKYAFLEKLLTVRHQRGLKTEFTDVHIAEPLQFSSEFFQDVEICRDAKLNFTYYSFEEIVQIVTPWMSRILRINAKIPNWSSRDLRVFRRRFNLLQVTKGFESRHNLNDIFGMAESGNCQSFYKIEDGKTKVFRFTGTQSGQFTHMLFEVVFSRNF